MLGVSVSHCLQKQWEQKQSSFLPRTLREEKHSWGCQSQRVRSVLLGPVSGLLGYGGQQPYLTKHSFLAYQNLLGSPLGIVKAELPETLCGREFKVRALKKVFGGAWISYLVTYSLVLTVDGCSLQGLGRAIYWWLAGRQSAAVVRPQVLPSPRARLPPLLHLSLLQLAASSERKGMCQSGTRRPGRAAAPRAPSGLSGASVWRCAARLGRR